MATTLKTKNSVTATVAPTTLQQGELAVNITDKKMWVGNAATTPVQIVGTGSGGGGAAGSNTQVQYNSSGALAGDADFTFNGTTVTMANDASISGLTVGKGGGAVATNTAVGLSALSATNTGGLSVGVGYNAGALNTSGRITAIGYSALASNTTGINTAIGYTSLGANTTGTQNNAFGDQALSANTTGGSNVAVGDLALRFNTTASNNTAVGYQSAYSNTTGTAINAFGHQTLSANTTGVGNSAFGGLHTGNFDAALRQNTTGNNNIAFGSGALSANTTGSSNTSLGYASLAANTTASNNTAVGYQAGYSNTTGANSVYLGIGAGRLNTTANDNCMVGYYAGESTTGGGNTFFGGIAGNAVTTGTKNTIIGRYNGNQGGLDIRTASNYIVLSDGDGNPRQIIDGSGKFLIGKTASALGTAGVEIYPAGEIDLTASGQATLFLNRLTSDGNIVNFYRTGTQVGNINVTASATAYVTSSDYRLKENVQPMTGALATVAQLKPVTYDWKIGGVGQGFIAHELQAVVPDCVTGDKDAVDEEGKPVYQGIDTSFLVATLAAAIQELKAEFDAYKTSHP